MNSSTIATSIAVVLAVAIVVIVFFFPGYIPGFGSSASKVTDATLGGAQPANETASQTPNQNSASESPAPAVNPNAVSMQDVSVGGGATAQAGDQVTVQYVGKLADGTVFDQSSSHTTVMQGCTKAGVFCFQLGSGQVIPGWDQGVIGMKVGGERKLIIPPSLAYGNQQIGPIPANSTLYFDIKLVDVKKPGANGQPFAPTGPAAE